MTYFGLSASRGIDLPRYLRLWDRGKKVDLEKVIARCPKVGDVIYQMHLRFSPFSYPDSWGMSYVGLSIATDGLK